MRHPSIRLCLGFVLLACNPQTGTSTTTQATASSSSAAKITDGKHAIDPTLRAEVQRDPSQLGSAQLHSHDRLERQRAVRALARMANPQARKSLEEALHDEDPRVVAWAAFGLGELCSRQAKATVSRLVANLSRWQNVATGKQRQQPEPLRSFARAIGRCNDETAERTLTDWALRRNAGSRAAIEALGDLVTSRPRPREETFVALLKLASGDATHDPMPYALYPLGRSHLPEHVATRAKEVAIALLDKKSPERIHAVRTLARSGDETTPLLAKILRSATDYDANERAEAARALGKRGTLGQKAIHATLAKLLPQSNDAIAATSLIGPDFGPLLVSLQSLTSIRKSRATLRKYARLAAPPKAPPAVKRRLSWLRCSAAQILAERNFNDPDLQNCDLSASHDKNGLVQSTIGARAIVAAIGIDGTKIRGKRHRAWSSYAKEGPLRARQDALQLIADHGEIRDTAEVLAIALKSNVPGLVAAASMVISKDPASAYQSGGKGKKRLAPKLVKALLAQLGNVKAARDLESTSSAIEAAAALRLAEARPLLEKLCSDPYVTIRLHTAKALSRMKGKKQFCDRPRSPLPAPVELQHLQHGTVDVRIESDAGQLKLQLDARVAPIAVTRFVDLARRGFYNGNIVHRVVPGFVSQFGSPTADGYGGDPKRPALPCETSPRPFGHLHVGVALAGRDTGSSQFFVTHQSFPHLDGRYSWVGTASGPWTSLVDGDRITKVTVLNSSNAP